MFHLALYFDEKTNQKFSFLNKKVEKELHQNYLENHHIPFHLTIATYKEIEEKKFIEQANQLFEKESSQELYFVSLGCFQKSTLYLLPVYNEFLNQLILKIYQTFDEYVSISQKNRYLPYHFVPHVSISRKLNEQQTNQPLSHPLPTHHVRSQIEEHLRTQPTMYLHPAFSTHRKWHYQIRYWMRLLQHCNPLQSEPSQLLPLPDVSGAPANAELHYVRQPVRRFLPYRVK